MAFFYRYGSCFRRSSWLRHCGGPLWPVELFGRVRGAVATLFMVMVLWRKKLEMGPREGVESARITVFEAGDGDGNESRVF